MENCQRDKARDTKRYQEIPRDTVWEAVSLGIPLVSFGILWYPLVSLGISGVGGAAEIPRDTKGIPLGYRLPNGISWYLCCSSRCVSHLGFRLRLMLRTQLMGFQTSIPATTQWQLSSRDPEGYRMPCRKTEKCPKALWRQKALEPTMINADSRS